MSLSPPLALAKAFSGSVCGRNISSFLEGRPWRAVHRRLRQGAQRCSLGSTFPDGEPRLKQSVWGADEPISGGPGKGRETPEAGGDCLELAPGQGARWSGNADRGPGPSDRRHAADVLPVAETWRFMLAASDLMLDKLILTEAARGTEGRRSAATELFAPSAVHRSCAAGSRRLRTSRLPRPCPAPLDRAQDPTRPS